MSFPILKLQHKEMHPSFGNHKYQSRTLKMFDKNSRKVWFIQCYRFTNFWKKFIALYDVCPWLSLPDFVQIRIRQKGYIQLILVFNYANLNIWPSLLSNSNKMIFSCLHTQNYNSIEMSKTFNKINVFNHNSYLTSTDVHNQYVEIAYKQQSLGQL